MKNIFPFRFISKKELEQLQSESNKNLVKRVELEGEIQNLLLENKNLIGQYKRLSEKSDSVEVARKAVEAINVFEGDPIPLDSLQRISYVSQVAGTFKDIFEPKFKHMISRSLLLLEDSTNDREFDLAVKGAIYFARECIRWGNLMVSEQIQNQVENTNVNNKKD